MSDIRSIAQHPVYCPVRSIHTFVSVYIVSIGTNFLAKCNGCEFESCCDSCEACKANSEHYWHRLHLAHPDLSASQLTALPPEELS